MIASSFSIRSSSIRDAMRRRIALFRARPPRARRLIARDLAIDLGTANTLVYMAGHGIVVDEPSVVAIDVATQRVRAIGHPAKRMIGRSPTSIRVVSPLRDGVIADFDVAEAMLRSLVSRALGTRSIVRPRMVIAVPSSTTAVERRAVCQSAISAGARDVVLIEEAIAAAIGAGLPVMDPRGSLVVDIGGGTTEVAVLSLGGTVCSRGARVGGDEIDRSIALHIKRSHDLLIGATMAENVKLALASALPLAEPRKLPVRGRDLVHGVPRGVEVSSDEIREAIQEPLESIVRVVTEVLEATPPELAADVIDSGMTLTGGGALLPGIDAMLTRSTGLAVTIADQPLCTVVLGAGRCLADLPLLRSIGRRS